jgi:HEAT repeat protein
VSGDIQPSPDEARGSTEVDPAASILGAVERAFAARRESRGPAGARTPSATPGESKPPPQIAPPRPAAEAANRPVGERRSLSSLRSADPSIRREALDRIAADGIDPGDRATTEAVAAVLLGDPDPELRTIAARLLLEVGWGSRPDVERALRDPDDQVRAAVVKLAAARGASALDMLVPLVSERRWPLTQQATLATLAPLVAGTPSEALNLEPLLHEVGSLEPPPLWSEGPALEAVARAIGRDRLLQALEGTGRARMGAARLLVMVGERIWLRPVAALAADPSEEIRTLAHVASTRLNGHEILEGGTPEPGAAEAERPAIPGAAMEDQLICAVARALSDPVERVRRQADATIAMLPRAALKEWAGRTLAREPDAPLAATVIERVRMAEVAPDVLWRACRTPAEDRGPYLAALAALRQSPGELARTVLTVDIVHRPTAVHIAWRVGGRPVLPFLTPMLEDPVGAVRSAVLESLSEADDPSTPIEASRLLASDSSAAVRATAVRALAEAPPEIRTTALATALADPDPDVQAIAVEILPRGTPGAMARELLHALMDDDERVWRPSLRHLAALPEDSAPVLWSAISSAPPERRQALIATLERTDPEGLARLAVLRSRSPEPADRALAVELAAQADSEAAGQIVLVALADPAPSVRREAAAALSTLRTPEAVGALERTLSDPQSDVRVAAVRALGLIDDDGVPAVLISALRDPEVRVRHMATEALTRWRSPAVARRLAQALAAPDLRRAVATVLERMDQAAVEPLVEIIAVGDPETRAAAAAALDKISGPGPFVERLGSTDPEERYRATEVLGAIGGSEAAEALLVALGDPAIRIRSRAARLLGAMNESRAFRPLRRMLLSDPVPEVAAAAEEALQNLGSLPGRDLQEEIPGDDSEA